VRSYRIIRDDQLGSDAGRRSVAVDGKQLCLESLGELLGLPSREDGTLIEVLVGGVAVALLVDGVVGEEEVFMRPMPPAAGAPTVFDGITLLASGRPVPVLSLPRVGRLAGAG
jgi:chemotaxis protein histidine kinase CheA